MFLKPTAKGEGRTQSELDFQEKKKTLCLGTRQAEQHVCLLINCTPRKAELPSACVTGTIFTTQSPPREAPAFSKIVGAQGAIFLDMYPEGEQGFFQLTRRLLKDLDFKRQLGLFTIVNYIK